jgi:hypothetical protein
MHLQYTRTMFFKEAFSVLGGLDSCNLGRVAWCAQARRFENQARTQANDVETISRPCIHMRNQHSAIDK